MGPIIDKCDLALKSNAALIFKAGAGVALFKHNLMVMTKALDEKEITVPPGITKYLTPKLYMDTETIEDLNKEKADD